MEMNKKVIEARVIQKVGTEAEWMSNPLTLYNGEVAFVRTSIGRAYNIKIGQDGKEFKDLPYAFDYSRPTQPALPTTNFNDLPNGMYLPLENGNYSGVEVDFSEGFTMLMWIDGELKKTVFDISGQGGVQLAQVVESMDINRAPSGDAVYRHTKNYFDAINNGGVFNFEIKVGGYNKGEVVKHKGLLWIANTKTGKTPGTTYEWESYYPLLKPYGNLIGAPIDIIFDSEIGDLEIRSNCTLSSVIGSPTIFPQKVKANVDEDYFVITFDIYNKKLRSINEFYRGVNDIPLCTVIHNNNTGKYEVYGLNTYTLKDGDKKYLYPLRVVDEITFNDDGFSNTIPNVQAVRDFVKEMIDSGGQDVDQFVKKTGLNALDDSFAFGVDGNRLTVPRIPKDATLSVSVNGVFADASGNIDIDVNGGGEGGGTIDNVSVNGTDAPIIDKRAVLTITKDTVGLEKVNNTSDAEKLPNDLVKAEIAKQIAESGTGGGLELTNEYLPNDQTKATSSTAVKDFDTKTNDFTTNADGGEAGKKYWIKGQPIIIGNYYNKQEIDDKLSNVSPSITLGFGLTKDAQGKTRLGEEKVVQGVTFNYVPTNVAGTDDKGFLIGNLLDKLENSHGFLRYNGFTGLQEVGAILSLMEDSAMIYKDNSGANIFQNSTFADGKNRLFANANRIFMTGEESATLGVVGANSAIRGVHVSKTGVTYPSLTIQDINSSPSNSAITKEWSLSNQLSKLDLNEQEVRGVVKFLKNIKLAALPLNEAPLYGVTTGEDNILTKTKAVNFTESYSGTNIPTTPELKALYPNAKEIICMNTTPKMRFKAIGNLFSEEEIKMKTT